MAVRERRERERAERRQLILRSARELAEAEGWEAVTTRRLADRVEYSQPVLYSHFAGKDAIVAAVAVEGFAELAAQLRAARTSGDRPSGDRPSGSRSDADRANSDQADGDPKGGNPADDNPADGDRAASDRAASDRLSTSHASRDGAGADRADAEGADIDRAEAALRAVAASYVEFARTHPALYDAMFAQPVDLTFGTGESPSALRDAFGELRTALLPVMENQDVESLTEVFWSSLHGLVTLGRGHRLRVDYAAARLDILVDYVAGPHGHRTGRPG
jgi:AcrR family transcriptional regulator